MKTSTKLVAAIMFIASVTLTNKTRAQNTTTMDPNPFRFGIGVETGIPTGTINKNSRWYLGGTARLQYNTTSHLGITLTSGYYNLFVDKTAAATTTIGNYTYGTSPHSLGIIPVKLGLKAFTSNGMYLSAEGGVGFETSYNQDKKLILSPGIGWSGSSIDVSARYENFSGQNTNYGLMGIRIAYGFGL